MSMPDTTRDELDFIASLLGLSRAQIVAASELRAGSADEALEMVGLAIDSGLGVEVRFPDQNPRVIRRFEDLAQLAAPCGKHDGPALAPDPRDRSTLAEREEPPTPQE